MKNIRMDPSVAALTRLMNDLDIWESKKDLTSLTEQSRINFSDFTPPPQGGEGHKQRSEHT